MKTNDQIANWAMDLQSLAQAGLRYGHDVFDRERYEEIRRIAGEMMSARTGIPEEKLKTLFLGDEYNKPVIATNIKKIFYLCKEISGKFTPNDETDACDYFNLDNLPKLSLGRNTKEQIAMCFDANNDPDWDTKFE